jgi:hypothetical protein
MPEQFTFKTEADLEYFSSLVKDKLKTGAVTVEFQTRSKTQKQHNSIWLWCSRCADALNDAGIGVLKFFKPGTEVAWTAESYRDNVWKLVQNAMYGTTSTKDLTRDQVGKIADMIHRKNIEVGINVQFPSLENQRRESLLEVENG